MFAPLKLALLVVVATCASPIKLPSYITPCKRNPTLNDCATKEAAKVLPTLLDGDKSLKIPNFKPLKLPEVKIDVGNNLNIKLTDVIINGFEDHKIEGVNIDLDKHHIILKLLFPRLNLVSHYDINGRILVLPIRGSGPANITFVDGHYIYDADFEINKRGGQDYMKLVDPKLDYTTERSYYYLDNLFDGDQVLGTQMNKFLDENWQDVSKDLGPAIANVVSAVATSLTNALFDQVPSNEIFPL